MAMQFERRTVRPARAPSVVRFDAIKRRDGASANRVSPVRPVTCAWRITTDFMRVATRDVSRARVVWAVWDLPAICTLASANASRVSADGERGEVVVRLFDGGNFRNCDICLPGYWDLTVDGCKPCQCDRFGTVRDLSNTGLSCDAQTGRCYCIEGVRGERCDQCEEFYTIVEGLSLHC